MTLHTTRRGFLASASLLIVGFGPTGALVTSALASGTDAQVNPFVKIAADGTVTVVLKHFEMGQGTTTGLTTLVAEEMDADWDRVAIEFAPADNTRYANLAFGAQGTGGSTAIANSWMQYRQAGAAARDVLVRAAAQTWGVAPDAVRVEAGQLNSGAHSAHFGEMAALAATLTPSAEPVLKAPDAWRLIGDAGLRRKDSAGKVDGSAPFATDVRLPGMVHATILRSPKFGGKLVGFDAAGAAAVPGFVDAKAMPNGAGVAVFATGTWAAIQARAAVTAEWDFSAAETRSTEAMVAEHLALTDAPAIVARAGDVSALATAPVKVEADFVFPLLAHAPMEPLTCTIEPVAGGGVRVHDGCQFPAITHPTVAAILGLKPEQVEINTLYAGGSFGRRANTVSDYQAEAAMAFALLGGTAPVKLVWTREDDLSGGFYRPLAAHRVRIGLANGLITAWDHRIAVKSIMKGTPFESVMVKDGVDPTSVEGVADTHYAIPGFAVGLTDAQTPMPVLWWRSVGHTHTAFAMESLMDMAAAAVGADPVAFRLGLLGGDPDQRRLAGVLRLVADKSGWGDALPQGRGRGVAVHKSFGTYVAEVVEVSLAGGAVKVEKVWAAVDCGVAVNPDVIRAQIEGGIGYGLGAVMRNQITLTDGVVDQANFPDYEPLRIADMPQIEVHIVPSTEAPSGIGEPGVPPVGPALANAIFAATGTRVTRLPFTAAGVSFA